MTPSEREEIEKVALKIRCKLIEEYGDECMIGQGYQAGVDLEVLIAKAMLTQVEKARAEQREIDAKICDKYTGAVCGCQKMLAEIIRNKLNQKGE